MRTPLTTIDFSEHEFNTYIDKFCNIYELKIPNSSTNCIRYINSFGTMTVTGDFGNWVFDREFHPSNKGYVSPQYWDEKLDYNSKQTSHKFDTDETVKGIEQFKVDLIDYGNEMDDEMIDWLEELESNVFDEYEYIVSAYHNNPSDIDTERVPFGEIRHKYLEYIYDGFDEICRRTELNLFQTI